MILDLASSKMLRDLDYVFRNLKRYDGQTQFEAPLRKLAFQLLGVVLKAHLPVRTRQRQRRPKLPARSHSAPPLPRFNQAHPLS